MTNTHVNQGKHQHRLGFDTHKAVKKLAAKGVKEVAAEAIVETIQEVVVLSYENLATKHEVQEVKQELKQDIQEVRHEIQKSHYEQKLYANKMALAIIVGAPTFYTGLEFLIKFLAK